MAGFVQSLGLDLVDKGNKPFDLQQLAPSDVIAFYFSAHWCPPCRQFTPVLKKFVQALEAAGDTSLRIIFVSSDKSESEMWQYMYEAHGDWLALRYGSSEKDKLSSRYSVSGIPALVVINQVGQSVVPSAVQHVMQAMQNSTQVFKTFFDWRSITGAAPAAPPCTRLASGTRVKLRGLVSKPQLNGQEGSVQNFSRDKERYFVQVAEEHLALKGANLLHLAPVVVSSSSGEGQDAVIVDFDEASGELVLLQDGEQLRARFGSGGSVTLREGAFVVVQGLQAESAKPWNEHLGRVARFDAEKGRYAVEVAPGKELLIKPDNVRLCPLV